MAINVDNFVTYLRKHQYGGYGNKQCALYVRQALEHAGGRGPGNINHAKAWGPALLGMGFHEVVVPNPENFLPMKGDVAVIQGTSTSVSGHIQGYDGRNWISDFIQQGFWPGPAYRTERPSYVIYRP